MKASCIHATINFAVKSSENAVFKVLGGIFRVEEKCITHAYLKHERFKQLPPSSIVSFAEKHERRFPVGLRYE